MAQLKMEWMILVVTLATVACQDTPAVPVPPIQKELQPAVAQVGETVNFTCDTNAGLNNSGGALVWARDINSDGETDIATFLKGAMVGTIKDPSKFSIHNRTLLTVHNVTMNDAGRYICKVLPDGMKSIANLIVIEPPRASGENELRPGQNATFECNVRFGGPRKDLIQPGEMPELKSFVNNKFSEGEEPEVTEGVPGSSPWEIRQQHIVQVANDSQHTMYNFSCEVHTEEPRKVITVKTNSSISEPVHDVVITPLKDTYEVGEVITCTAKGHPTPVMGWTPVRTSGSRTVASGNLTVTNQMVGANTWKCHATNTVENQPHREELEISFDTPKPSTVPSKAPQKASSNTMTIIIVVVVVIVVVLLAVIIGAVVYKRRNATSSGYAAGQETRAARNADYTEGNQDSDAENGVDIRRDQSVAFNDKPTEIRNKPTAAPRHRDDEA